MQYEGLHALCFHCGRYGHLLNTCPALVAEASEQQAEATSSKPSDGAPSKMADAMDQMHEEGDKTACGSWMTATKSRRRPGHRPVAADKNLAPKLGGNGSNIPAENSAKHQQRVTT